ncbi:MAG: hypothetical protein H4O13_05170 [Xanthomonadales bacterium]|nr:hypothetical protein [Xanthomonadales bacterium]
MTTEIREFRRMIDAAKRYLAQECSIQELYGRVGDVATASKFLGGHPALVQIADDWSAVIDRRWNECGHVPDPLSEAKFRSWLAQQISLL